MKNLSATRRAILLCLVVLGVLPVLKAQKTSENPMNYLRTDLVSPSATAATLGRYGDASVNQSSGAPNLSIPIFTVTGHDLSVPIVLSYSYDGFKPAQPNGWTGMGWNLQAGGVITRQIRGRVDDIVDTENQRFGSSFVQSNIVAAGGYESTDMQNFLKGVMEGGYDGEADIFSFNFGGYSGKFTLVNGVFTLFPYSKLKISGSAAGFTITTEDGTKYGFGDVEHTSPKSTYSGPGSYNIPYHVSAWYLTSITNAANTEAIRLLYTTDTSYPQLGTNSQTYKLVEDVSSGGSSQLYAPYFGFSSYIDPVRLTTIISERQTVDFSGGASRKDILTGPPVLGSITVTDNNSGEIIKNFRFKYGYFGTGTYLEKYLKLKSLEELPGWKEGEVLDTTKKQVHTFDYIAETGSYPNRTEAFVDHYGYYKGGSFGNIMIPDYIYPGGPNRDPSPLTAQFGALKKITYPTGGSTTFDYEGNVGFNGKDYVKIPSNLTSYVYRPSGAPPLDHFESDFESGKFTINYGQRVGINLVRYPKSLTGDGNIKGSFDARLYREVEDGIYAFIDTWK
ncbi:hypothetical protein VRU48_19580, partial [Pedobacter sp. KR3-3]